MSWSNIYLQLITATGPILGEGLLDGWEGSIELRGFDWGMTARTVADQSGAGFGLAGLKSALGVSKNVPIVMQPLTFKKRFDVASAQIHTCLDNHLPVVSASITVLHFSPSALPKGAGGDALSVANPAAGAMLGLHKPGFILLATDGYFESVNLDLEQDGLMSELVETVTLNFKAISVSYVKGIGPAAVPMPPFIYSAHPTDF
jgi:type VI protein secretion system component Hcp